MESTNTNRLFKVYVGIMLFLIVVLLAGIVGGLSYAAEHAQSRINNAESQINSINRNLNNITTQLNNLNTHLESESSASLSTVK